MANRLARESSPYLRQHGQNPVDWYPWGDEALAAARERDVPLLVSIGYSACHWCHVMAHESFEDEAIAALMNERFVCVKVDREERPDIDALCMEAVQALTGSGGWPLNAFLTPEQVPFYGGTYFPPQPVRGMPSWRALLDAVAQAWSERREQVREQGERITERLAATSQLAPSTDPLHAGLLDEAVQRLASSYDAGNGGFGGAPKFPPASAIELLLARGERTMALGTLRAMAAGGIHDQLAGGFARYAVDATWTVPHFEKMLYDNALLARAYLHGYQVSSDDSLAAVCRDTLDWALREMRGPEGGFYAALDADSEGEEGRFYVFTPDQVRAALAPDSELSEQAISYYGVTEQGTFEGGASVLQRAGPPPERLDEIRARLLAARERRVRPGLDDKRLTSWNALMISALADAGAALARPDYLDAARRCAAFVLERLRDGDGRLLRTYSGGRAAIGAYLEDHAFLLEALLDLYEATWEERWFGEARALADTLIERFADPEHGGFFSTPEGGSSPGPRRKDLEDSPIPSGNSSAAYGLLRLAALTGERRYEQAGAGVLALLQAVAVRHPQAFSHLLAALDFHVSPVREVAIVGPDPEPLARVVRGAFHPHLVLAGASAPDGEVPLLRDRTPVDGRAAAYVCESFSCRRPVTEPAELERELASVTGPAGSGQAPSA